MNDALSKWDINHDGQLQRTEFAQLICDTWGTVPLHTC